MTTDYRFYEAQKCADGEWWILPMPNIPGASEGDACAWVADCPDGKLRMAYAMTLPRVNVLGNTATVEIDDPFPCIARSHYAGCDPSDPANRCKDVRKYNDFICISVKIAANGAATQGEPLPPIGLTPEEARP